MSNRLARFALPLTAALVLALPISNAAADGSHRCITRSHTMSHVRGCTIRTVVRGTVGALSATSVTVNRGRRSFTFAIVAGSKLNGAKSGDVVRAYGHYVRPTRSHRHGAAQLVLDRLVVLTAGGGTPPPPPPPPPPAGPSATITGKPAASTTATTATISWTTAGTVTVNDCALDGSAFAACTSPSNLTGLAVGAHSYVVRVSDGTNTSTAVASWTVVTSVPAPTAAPSNTSVPVITGPGTTPLRNANVLSASTGVWSNKPTAYKYQWLRCTTNTATSSCTSISGATGASYTLDTSPSGGDSQKYFRVTVTATNASGSASATSAPTTKSS